MGRRRPPQDLAAEAQGVRPTPCTFVRSALWLWSNGGPMHHEVERLVGLYDQGGLSRRQLLQGLFALGIGRYAPSPPPGGFRGAVQSPPLFHTRTLNHVTLFSSNVARSKAFYQQIGRKSTRLNSSHIPLSRMP